MSKLIVYKFNKLLFSRTLFSQLRLFHPDFSKDQIKEIQTKLPEHKYKEEIPAAIQQKYEIYRDENAPEIFDVEEEKQQPHPSYQFPESNEFAGINLKRGVHGVFDIEDLVDALRQENAIDIFVCEIPKEYKYVDYMCIVSGRSYRHMLAMAEFIRRIFKEKRHKNDRLPKIEGEKSRDWIALDMGNIALHIFSESARTIYDLESLWSIGSEFDEEYNKPDDPLIELFKKHSVYLHDLQSPARSKN